MAFGKKEINAVTVLGVRTSEQTKVLATYNMTIYCLLVEYKDGSRKVVECGTGEMAPYLPFIPMR